MTGKIAAFLTVLLFFAIPAFSQNTKGDKPARSSDPLARPKLIFKSKNNKGKDRPKVGDISGRRLRTKDKSSATHAIIVRPDPYKSKGYRRKSGDRAAQPIQGSQRRIHSSTAKAARNNIYPSNLSGVTAPRPKDNQRAHSNRNAIRKVERFSVNPNKKSTRVGQPIKAVPPSMTKSIRGAIRRNTYWGKFKKKEKGVTTDITGRPLRGLNRHSPGLGLQPESPLKKIKRSQGEHAYNGTFRGGNSPLKNKRVTQRAWTGDISGRPLRYSKPKRNTEVAGKFFFPRLFTISGKFNGAGKPMKYSKWGSYPGNYRASNNPLPVREPGIGASGIERFLGKLTGRRTFKGGGSNSGNISNKPYPPKEPGFSAGAFTRFLNKTRGRKGVKGGGSISGRSLSRTNPLPVREPGMGATAFEKFLSRVSGKKSPKGGGSISGSLRNNRNKALNVREPGMGINGINYSGNNRGKKPKKGGGSISGYAWNNRNTPLQQREPGIGINGIGYQGTLKAKKAKPLAGSISGFSRNNRGNPIAPREPGIGVLNMRKYRGFFLKQDLAPEFTKQGIGFAGNLKAKRPEKGGGSISGMARNNRGNPIAVREPGQGAIGINYRGKHLRLEIVPGFTRQGELYRGDIKAKRLPQGGGGTISGNPRNNRFSPLPVKEPGIGVKGMVNFRGKIKAKNVKLGGGGSISDRLWNNKEQPINVRTPLRADAKEANSPGNIKLSLFKRHFIKNPNQDKDALKKHKPSNVSYSLNDNLAKKTTVSAREYINKIKLYWAYKHNPSSAKEGLDVRRPNKAFSAGNLAVKGMRLKDGWRHNPHSDKHALIALAPGKAAARIGNFQGNVKMFKPHGKNLHPDAKFAHGFRDNVKEERTILMNIKLLWAKLFRKNDTQPAVVKEKLKRPRYDKNERELWKELYH